MALRRAPLTRRGGGGSSFLAEASSSQPNCCRNVDMCHDTTMMDHCRPAQFARGFETVRPSQQAVTQVTGHRSQVTGHRCSRRPPSPGAINYCCACIIISYMPAHASSYNTCQHMYHVIHAFILILGLGSSVYTARRLKHWLSTTYYTGTHTYAICTGTRSDVKLQTQWPRFFARDNRYQGFWDPAITGNLWDYDTTQNSTVVNHCRKL